MSSRATFRRLIRQRRIWGGIVGLMLIGGLSVYTLFGLLRSETQGVHFQQAIGRINGGMFALASLVYLVALLSAITGWGLILGRLSAMWNWPQHARIYCVTAVTRRLPGTVWYIFGRMMLYERYGIPRGVTTVASGLEFALIMISAVLVILLSWPLTFSIQSLNPWWLVGGLLIGMVVLNPWLLRQAVRRLSRGNAPIDLRYRHLLVWISVYALVWFFGGSVLFVLMTMIHPLALTMLPTAVGIWTSAGLVTSLLAFVPFGLIQEITLAGLLTPYLGSTEALVVALLMRGVLTINEVFWGLVAVVAGWRLPPLEAKTLQNEKPHSNAKSPEEVYKIPPLQQQK